jgi:membrane glycosyltransferase
MSLFGRVLQFAARLNSPMLAAGLTFWQSSESNYWGHNAIIRVQAFMAHCGLPHLPGQAPLGGEILSHDFVEAALMRRGGWTVHLLPDAGGSYEEMPESLLDFAKRDRRWCQGNLQHLRLVTARGLHPMSRLHFLLGALAYMASPFWFALLLFSTAQILHEATIGHQYFSPGYTLFPNWPVSKASEIMSLLTMTAITLTLPRGMSLVLALLDSRERRGFGGGIRLALSTVLDLLFSMLIAPVMMMLHAYFVVGTLLGSNVTWATQRRGSHRLPFSEATARLWVPMLIGLAWGALILSFAPHYAWWLAPVLAGLLLAVPVAVLSSDERVGRWFARHGLFLTPEERDPPAELRWEPVAPETDIAAHAEAPPLPPPLAGLMEPQALDPITLRRARRRRRSPLTG